MSKILFLDIETQPAMAAVWRFYKENISPKQVLAHGEVLSWAAKWADKDEIYYLDTYHTNGNEKKLLEPLVQLLDEADIVVGHYAQKFDIPKIKGRAAALGIKPPSPFKIVDTKLVASKEFDFEGNSLEYLCEIFQCAPKLAHKKFPGFELWLECMKGNKEAFVELREYNIGDVISVEALYYKIRPWITNHPNLNVFNETEEHICPKCGGKHLQKRGLYRTDTRSYQRYQCQTCHGWSRARLMDKDTKTVDIVNAG